MGCNIWREKIWQGGLGVWTKLKAVEGVGEEERGSILNERRVRSARCMKWRQLISGAIKGGKLTEDKKIRSRGIGLTTKQHILG